MTKSEAINLLGGTVRKAADAIGITIQAVHDWPDPLSRRIEDRVHAAIARAQRASASSAIDASSSEPAGSAYARGASRGSFH